jgi:hypothetical protein
VRADLYRILKDTANNNHIAEEKTGHFNEAFAGPAAAWLQFFPAQRSYSHGGYPVEAPGGRGLA